MSDNIEKDIEMHYARPNLEAAILDAIARSGIDADKLTADDLAPVDEFHTGGREATADLAAAVGFATGSHLLDVGCGIGGASRFFAGRGYRVTGVDLTADYVHVAAALSRRVGFNGAVDYRRASAEHMPFDDAAFDGAYMIHVGMNIADKVGLFGEVRRVLKPGAAFAIFDIMRIGDAEPVYPQPWAASAKTSFLATPAAYAGALAQAGFTLRHERNRRDFARDFFRKLSERMKAAGGPPQLGLHLLMKADFREKIADYVRGLDDAVVAPVEMIAIAEPRS